MHKKIVALCQLLLLFFSILLEYNREVVIIHYITNVIMILLYFKNKYYQGWYILSLTTILYSFPHFVYVFFFEGNPLFHILNQYGKIANDINLNLIGFRYLNVFVGSLILFSTVFKYDLNIKINEFRRINKGVMILIVLLIIVFFIYGVTQIDFASISEEYALPKGYSIVLGTYYWLFFILLYYFSYRMYLKKNLFILIFILSITQPFLFFLGTRQMFFIFFLSLIILYFLIKKIKKENFKSTQILSSMVILFLFVYVFGIITKYRVTKTIDGETLDILNSFKMFYLGYNAETSLTIYNLMSSMDQSIQGNDFFFFPEIKDAIVMLIPSFLFDDRSNYLSFIVFDQVYNVAPFGTYFIIGELVLALRYISLFVVLAFFINYFSHYFYKKFLKNTDFIKITVYTLGLSILFFSPVRGLIAPAIKIFVTFVFSIYLLSKIKISYAKNRS
jgi:membrane protein